ncbi:MAG: CHAT domain-containing protein, partial [Flavobacteriaceae bacterium]
FRIGVQQKKTTVVTLGAYDSIRKKVNDFLNLVKSPSPQKNKFKEAGEELYTDLFYGIPPEGTTLIMPDGILNHLPFELLYNNGYLMEQTTISYLSGLFQLRTGSHTQIDHPENVSFFAPTYSKYTPTPDQLAVRGTPYDLKGAQEEVQVLSNLTNGVLFEGTRASKKEFMALSNEFSIIHMAGHAYLNGKDPELSSLLFSDMEKDNELHISELYGLKFNADLAVLSACNTGVGGYGSGEDMVSLSQAFMYSGIPSTVSSLWSAPDQSTKQIMVSFYEYLKEGHTKSKALQMAKLDYLHHTTDENLSHPYYWAGFVLYGNDTPITFNERKSTHYLLGALASMGILFYFLYRRRKKPLAT